jgi:uncharacterized protein YkwD
MPPISLSLNHSRARIHVEELEARLLLSWSQPSDLEQVFLERLNDARANPAAYGASIGVDLSGVAPSPPLALNPYLTGSAQLHSQDMNNRRFFDHTNPDGLTPPDRMRASGFNVSSWAESIAGGYATPDAALKGLIVDNGVPDLGHRRQLLAIDPADQGLNQAGVGIVFGTGPYGSYYTIDSASGFDNRPFITGVVFRDSSGRYNAGEGIGNIAITVIGVGSTTSLNTGGYSIQVNPGTYQVVASGPGLAGPVVQTVTVGAANVRVNFNLANPPPPYLPTGAPVPGAVMPVVTTNDAAGRPVLFVQGLDNQVYMQHLDAGGAPVSGYVLAGAGQVKSFAVGHDGWGNPEVFAVGLDDAVYSLHFDGNDQPWGGYNQTRVNRIQSVTAGHDASGLPELFALGLDNQVYALKFDAAGNAVGDYFLTAAGVVKSFAVGNDAWGEPEVFAIGLNDMVYADKLTGAGYPGSGYFLIAPNLVKAIALGHDAYGDPEVFAIGLNDLVYIQRFDAGGNPQGGFASTCNVPVKSIQIGYDAFNRPELFATGFDDQVYAEVFNADGSALGACLLSRPGRIKSVTVGRDAAGRPELFVIGLDDQVYAQAFDAAGNSAGDYYLTAPGQVK